MPNEEIIRQFYDGFAESNAEKMIACYHEQIQFTDPAFGTLKGEEAKKMWQMLLERGSGNIEIEYKNVKANDTTGAADWTARYIFSQTGRNVFNQVHAEFVFADGKIIRHVDDFDFWKWSRQALGLPGILLGWSSFLRNKVCRTANNSLREYVENSSRNAE